MGFKNRYHSSYDPMNPTVALLLINTGSPDAPTTSAVKSYLAEFLGDKRVVELPRWKWWPILHGIILNTRPRKSAERYRGVWTEAGSPLVLHCAAVAQRLGERLSTHGVAVHWAMCYGHPNVAETFEKMRNAGIERVLVMPMFAQYSSHTSASCLDLVFRECLRIRDVPALRTVHDYHDEPRYIDALKRHVERYWTQHGSAVDAGGRLLLSFHGIPQASIDKGDKYEAQCHQSAKLLAASLNLKPEQWTVSFQSRFGPDPWVQPYTSETVVAMAQQGVRRIDVLCPGFAADCLETLEEIDDELRRTFLAALPAEHRCPEAFHYIPALNASDEAIDLYEAIALRELAGWVASLS